MKRLKKIRVCAVTGCRSDYGLLRWVMQDLKDSPAFDLKVMATGAHFLRDYGFTYRDILRDGFRIDARATTPFRPDSVPSIAAALGRWTAQFGKALDRMKPDLMLVMGDRYELLAACSAAVLHAIPIAHISGGEITEGAIDDQIRHAVTKLSHLHFASNTAYAKNLRALAEEPWRICVSGEPGLDNLRRLKLWSKKELERDLGFGLSGPVAVVTFHPVTLENENALKQIESLLSALATTRTRCVITYPNADLGSDRIIAALKKFSHRHADRVLLIKSLGQIRYLSLLSHAALMVGNSSSGLVEAPSFNLPVVNIGIRQQGRVRAANVIDVPCDAESIAKGVRAALRYRRNQRCVNPYGDGRSSQRVAHFIQKIFRTKTRGQILMKKFVKQAA